MIRAERTSPRRATTVLAALVAAVVFVAVACTAGSKLVAPAIGGPGIATPTAPTASPGASPPIVEPGPLCDRPELVPQARPSPATLPSALQKVADEVQVLRALRFKGPVSPEAVSHDRLVQLLNASIDHSFPRDMEARRGRAWATVGAIPAGTDLGQAYRDFAGSQIIGFYDTLSHRLVFIGTNDPSPLSQTILAHELTHALDDQAFGLSRLDQLENQCRDERFQAFLGLTEGDAVETQLRFMSGLSLSDQQSLAREAASFPPPPATVPSFLRSLLEFPYRSGRLFVESLTASGGQAAVNAAFRDPPVSTEQILHPDKFPGDAPRTVAVPQMREKLGGPWTDLDVMDVGEAWLSTLLALRLPSDEAATAAAGWDGGQYRAWSRGDQTAVLLQTVWDRDIDAVEFIDAMRRFGSSNLSMSIHRNQAGVDVLFGSDAGALRDLERAVG